jgi:hypothetical protein
MRTATSVWKRPGSAGSRCWMRCVPGRGGGSTSARCCVSPRPTAPGGGWAWRSIEEDDDQYLVVGARELDAAEAETVRRLLEQGGS